MARRRAFASWESAGRWYGYPPCCRRAFTRWDHVGMPARPLNGTGFVPCRLCMRHTARVLIARITKLRRCPTPFPID